MYATFTDFSVGLPCGGEIDVFVQEYDAELFERIGERRAVVYTDLSSGEQRLAFEGDDEQTDSLLRDARSQVTGNVFANLFGPPPRLLVFGAIDTAERVASSSQTGSPEGASALCGSAMPSASATTWAVAAVPRN